MTPLEAKKLAFNFLLEVDDKSHPNVWVGKVEDKGVLYMVEGGVFGPGDKIIESHMDCIVYKDTKKVQFPGGINMAELMEKYSHPA